MNLKKKILVLTIMFIVGLILYNTWMNYLGITILGCVFFLSLILLLESKNNDRK